MNKTTVFLAKHSQTLALVFGGIAFGVAYQCQPHYEMCCRWSLVYFKSTGEARTSDRIMQAADEVLSKFSLTPKQKSQLDLFLVGVDQPVALGSLTSKGYAFIGLPACSAYSDPAEIPADALQFYTPQFPYGPFSSLGQKRLNLMIIPEDALRFLLARELLQLGVRTQNGDALPCSARTNSLLTVSGMIGGIYAAYQAAYVLNRRFSLPVRWLLPSRLLLYTGLTLFTLFCQWQVMLAWRRYNCLRADDIVSALGEPYLRGGASYYKWRLRWNQFWHDHLLHQREAVLQKTIADGEYDPIKAYQDEKSRHAAGDSTKQSEDSESGYFLPRVDGMHPTDDATAPPENDVRPMQSGTFNYLVDPRTSSCGNERWAADGEPLGFGLTALLSLGRIAPPVARFLGLFVSPATSFSRLVRLENKLQHCADEA